MKLITSFIFITFLGIVHAQNFKTYSFLDKVWAGENATVKEYNNGDVILFAKDSEALAKAGLEQKGAWCYVNFDPSTEKELGLLYNHYVLTDARGFAPKGWRLPMKSDFTDLTDAHGGYLVAGARLRKNGSDCGFNALYNVVDSQGNSSANIWTNEQDGYNEETFWFYTIESAYSNVSKHSFDPSEALQVRFVKENNTETKTENPVNVHIGNQVWMSQNLSVKTFRNGDSILFCATKKDWKKAHESKVPAYCYYDFSANNGKKYGFIYNRFALMDERGIAPEGYKIPNSINWEGLAAAVKGDSKGFVAGNIMKNYTAWSQKDYCKKNQYDPNGFNAMPGGYLSKYGFVGILNSAYFWTKDIELTNLVLTNGYSHYQFDHNERIYGSYVRCILTDYAYLNSHKKYDEIKVGEVIFMKENLAISNYKNGDTIPQARSKVEWEKYGYDNIGAWCYYDFDAANKEKYGILYNGHVMKDARGICPEGWRIPNSEEIDDLIKNSKTVFQDYLLSLNIKGRVSIRSEFSPFPDWWMINEKKKRFFDFSITEGNYVTSGWSSSGNVGCYIKCVKEN